jgi:hypothetical protein
MKNIFFFFLVLSILLFYLYVECQPIQSYKEIIPQLFSDTSKIRFDGFYNIYDTTLTHSGNKRNEEYVSDHLVVFTKEDRIFRSSGVSVDSIAFSADYYRNLKPTYFGDYSIRGDSVFAHTPIELFIRGGRLKPFSAYFSGYIKNKDTILNWKMVPPYPDVKPKWNQYFINDTTPKMLYFIKANAVGCLDSISVPKL